MEIIDNRKQKQDEPFEIKVGEVVSIDRGLYLFARFNTGQYNFFSLVDGNRFCDPIALNGNTLLSSNKIFEGVPPTRVKAKVIIED